MSPMRRSPLSVRIGTTPIAHRSASHVIRYFLLASCRMGGSDIALPGRRTYLDAANVRLSLIHACEIFRSPSSACASTFLPLLSSLRCSKNVSTRSLSQTCDTLLLHVASLSLAPSVLIRHGLLTLRYGWRRFAPSRITKTSTRIID
jgi:hypothetical protein